MRADPWPSSSQFASLQFQDISTKMLCSIIATITLCEATALWCHASFKTNPLTTLLILRSVETAILIFWMMKAKPTSPPSHALRGVPLSCHLPSIRQGVFFGLSWSVIFGFLVSAAGLGIFLITQQNPITAIRCNLPSPSLQRLLFLLVGGLISPIAEELFFRGFLYTWLRRYGIIMALTLSTIAFALCHFRSGHLPLIQTVGGILFGLSYEKSRNIFAPITIHVLGNMAIFSLASLP